MLYNKRVIRFTAKVMLLTMVTQLIVPAMQTFALTSGPSQPEVQSFEPVGTTDMVDMFSGDFVYNIPLMDVEGYPINISYHGGVDMEQEASWVGLGWNINPGVINRSVRGLPDDMNGETIEKTLHIKDEKNITAGVGVSGEIVGVDDLLGIDIGADVTANFSNYRGVSANIGVTGGVNIAGMVSAGVNLGVGSQSGADVDLYGGLQFSTSKIIGGDVAAGCGFNIGSGYNSRTGLKDLNYGFSASVTTKVHDRNGGGGIGFGHATVPIGVRNIVPVITNASTMNMYRGRIKLGPELFGGYGYLNLHGSFSKVHYDENGNRPGYGYLYAQNGDDHSIMDFTRDKDGMFNKTMKLLPLGNMTYDIYGVSGQGTGGSFRPYRNDFGSVFDPVVSSQQDDHSYEAEFGAGNLFEGGLDVTTGHTDITSGPWSNYQRPFSQKQDGSIYENTYFKEAGEATTTNPGLLEALQGLGPMDGVASVNIPLKKPGSENMRDPRGNLIYYFTADEASKPGVASSGMDIPNYTSTNGFASGTNMIAGSISRTSNGRKGSQISEVVQVQTDGRRYIYGIPAMNTSQDEVTFATDGDGSTTGLISYNTGNGGNDHAGRDEYFSKTHTPAFAHSYLLSAVLSTDYVDIRGDGVTDDDFGSFTKFNYNRKNEAFHWKSPSQPGMAQFNQAFKADKKDNRGNYIQGTREQWMLHSVETRNFVAEFYTSERKDARGMESTDISYKLDSIKLYNKHDRLTNLTNAVPVKTVMFDYDYSLCLGVPNNKNKIDNTNLDDAGNTVSSTLARGKLTLKKIYVRYGNSDRSMLSPYQFSYGSNKAYSYANRDRWGGYSSNTNTEYPYVDQSNASLDEYAGAWSLNKITLPSGGTIELQYEADDYAYVMDKPAMEMFKVAGVGKSKDYSSGNQLYTDKNNPNLFLYFNRRTASENGTDVRDNYFKNADLIYFNAETRLTDDAYEPIKGYAKVVDVGQCSNDAGKGYVELQPQEINGGGALLNPVSYTAINFGRYYLPHIIFPGSDPDASGLMNILAGLKYAITELGDIAENPVRRMTEEGKAKDIRLANSYIRLNSPGLKKKGGGQRVKSIQFYDHWDRLAGGNAQDASYGKTYDYTTQATNGGAVISSGVASYEPQVGGDENPFRMPLDYVVQSGGSFPPHDPIGLYQEYPIGESLFPGASVGYSKVTVKSIHQQQGRSSQGVDIYDFYTAKDFPVKVVSTPLNTLTDINDGDLFTQTQIFEASQGYTLTFNDMHGKPRRTEHRILKPATGASELVSYQEYNYFTTGGQLDSDVPVVAYDPASGKMKKQTKTVGLEADITIDTREKKEEANAETYRVNLNVFLIGIFPVPVPWFYYENYDSKHEFRSVVATKVVQQYGILKEVVSSQEGAVTTVRNEAFDPVTGQALITSVNNEYNDHEFSVNYPAYWGYKSMGPSYQNTGYEEGFASVTVENHAAVIPISSMSNYKVGDEVYMTYSGGAANAWVTSMYIQSALDTSNITYIGCNCKGNNPVINIVDTVDISYLNDVGFGGVGGCQDPIWGNNPQLAIRSHLSRGCGQYYLVLKPRYKSTFPQNGSLGNVHLKIVRSGAKNQLNESIQSYTGMNRPFDGNGNLIDDLNSLINISAKEFSDTLTAILPKYDTLQNPSGFDSLNIYVNGTRQIKRVSKEYAYVKNRDYLGASTRTAGLFSASTLWRNGTYTDHCTPNGNYFYCYIDSAALSSGIVVNGVNNNGPGTIAGQPVYVLKKQELAPPNYSMEYQYLVPSFQSDPNWVTARTVTKYSPWGFELENRDAIGNYTAAMYGYNQQLPVALAQNARQQEILSDGFEDYRLLQVVNNLASFNVSPYSPFFNMAALALSSKYKQFNTTASNGMTLATLYAHTGKYSLKTVGAVSINFDLLSTLLTPGQPRYASFAFQNGKQYVLSYWMKPTSTTTMENYYTLPTGMLKKSNIIEGWQQVEKVFTAGSTTNTVSLPANCYIDDIRVYPADANMRAFVYHPANQRLTATLDENNFATFYEYDQEGNLVRTKKETEKGIMTVMESRSANVKGVH